jgi:hypothetical protein
VRSLSVACCAVAVWLGATACTPGWKKAGESQDLSPVQGRAHAPVDPSGPPRDGEADPSLRLSLTLPAGWNRVMRGDEFIATRDGVYLQNIIVERIHVDQTDQSDGPFPFAALTSKLWPVRTARYAKERFAPGMPPDGAARIVLESRRNNPGISDFRSGGILPAEIAGKPGFRTTYGFRVTLTRRSTPYKTVYCGFMYGNWFYGISYTAASRHYFDRDLPAFEAVLKSLRTDDGKTGLAVRHRPG